jgi:hypothetical protein
MKIYNLSYNNKELFEELYAITGNPYGFIKSIRSGGTGSPPLAVWNAPQNVMKIIRQNVDRKYTNIEILQNGIIIRFKSRLENYGVPVKFSDIVSIGLIELDKPLEEMFTALLKISLRHGDEFVFKVRTHEKAGLIKFFSKAQFEGKFMF